ncbi:molybdate transport system substrate-binding protein [Alteribacillus persepolensis]|uniref:Molybdate transport system substrate-binding protein n=1 Tax=Alteribacillus persepolensis TaxID=568899 RepID=A0A1G8IX70_9BACI|nr:molybdate ABC transporter substrate-binding protein [Alteribacillus persepolensis]SDI23584.1 molybdate transport system substrate-binding protein [Alteribacillus persepolensis]
MKKCFPLFLLFIMILTACRAEESNTEALHVAAASDLYDAFSEMGDAFEEDYGIEVVFSFGSTGQLTQQIEQGAAVYDVFAAAHVSYIDRLVEKGAVKKDTKQVLGTGKIGIVYEDSTYPELHRDVLTSDEIQSIAIANPDHAPYGQAAKQTLETWGIWDEIAEKLVYGENIRQALQYAESKNVDAAIVAAALSKQSSLLFTPISTSDHEPIVHALAVPEKSGHKENAQKFVDYVLSKQGQQILESYGFDSPAEGIKR